MQYPVIYAVLSCLNRCNSCSSYFAVMLEGSQKSDVSSQKIDDLPVLATCWSGTSVMLNSKVDGLVAYGST